MAHPILILRARAQVRAELRAQGRSIVEAFALAREVDGDTINTAVSMAPPEVKAEVFKVGAIGDGTILQAIIDFLKSDLGQALIKIILSLIVVV